MSSTTNASWTAGSTIAPTRACTRPCAAGRCDRLVEEQRHGLLRCCVAGDGRRAAYASLVNRAAIGLGADLADILQGALALFTLLTIVGAAKSTDAGWLLDG